MSRYLPRSLPTQSSAGGDDGDGGNGDGGGDGGGEGPGIKTTPSVLLLPGSRARLAWSKLT